MSEHIKDMKKTVIDVVLCAGLTSFLKLFWDGLELLFDGGIQESISDTVIAIILITILWRHIRKWIMVN